MLRQLTFGFLVVFSFLKGNAAVDCGYGINYYYCSPGQSCGSSYGDCRGLPIYVTTGIISLSILILSFCIRFCIQIHAKSQPATTAVIRPGHGTARSFANNNNTHVPVPLYREDAPPSYAVATTPAAGQTKY